jgi:hypothetical protein
MSRHRNMVETPQRRGHSYTQTSDLPPSCCAVAQRSSSKGPLALAGDGEGEVQKNSAYSVCHDVGHNHIGHNHKKADQPHARSQVHVQMAISARQRTNKPNRPNTNTEPHLEQLLVLENPNLSAGMVGAARTLHNRSNNRSRECTQTTPPQSCDVCSYVLYETTTLPVPGSTSGT